MKTWQEWHKVYENTDKKTKSAINRAFTAVAVELENSNQNFSGAMDDRAEKLISAIMEYHSSSVTGIMEK